MVTVLAAHERKTAVNAPSLWQSLISTLRNFHINLLSIKLQSSKLQNVNPRLNPDVKSDGRTVVTVLDAHERKTAVNAPSALTNPNLRDLASKNRSVG